MTNQYHLNTFSLSIKALWFITLSTLILTACATPKHQVSVDHTHNFAEVNTFYVQAPTAQINASLKTHLEAKISEVLNAKGLSSTTKDNADIIVGYLSSTSSKDGGATLSFGLGTGSYGRTGGISLGGVFSIPLGEQVSLHQTLQIDVVRNGQFIYSAFGIAELDTKNSLSARQRINELVETLFAEYPAKRHEKIKQATVSS